MKKTYSILNSVAALAADLTLSGGKMYVVSDTATTSPQINVSKISNYKKQAKVTAVAGLDTATVTAASSVGYRHAFSFSQLLTTGIRKQAVIDTLEIAADTATTIAVRLKAQFDGFGFEAVMTNTAGAMAIVAGTGAEIIAIAAITPSVVLSAHTAGVYAVNTGAVLIASGIAEAVSATNYTSIDVTFGAESTPELGAEYRDLVSEHTFYISETDGDGALLIAAITAVLENVVYSLEKHSSFAAINSTATATVAQVKTGYITSTSGAATTITLPTGTLLGAELGAIRGTVHELYIDNTAGSNTVTIAVATDGILSTGAADTAGSFGDLTVASGATGIGRYTIMFSSATTYVFTRSA